MNPTPAFTPEQKAFLEGFLSGIRGREETPGPEPSPGGAGEPTVHGIPLSDLCKEEQIKYEEHPFDIWERMGRNAEADRFPEGPDVFRYKFHGLFYVTPAQEALMLRCRIPGGILSWTQAEGLADLAARYADGRLAITTRSNIQIRNIPPRHAVDMLTGLADLGLTSRGAGADNVRNLTMSPLAGIDPDELIDVRPMVREIHHRILNDRTLYDLPRKFNIALDGGGKISALADTNDIGFYPVSFNSPRTLPNGTTLNPGIHFRVWLGGVTGHQTFAKDAGLWVPPKDVTATAVSILRVFQEHGDRTNRKKARLKYLLESWGMDRFSAEILKRGPSTLRSGPWEAPATGLHVDRRAHIGLHPQKGDHLFYGGVAVPVGLLTTDQMRGLSQAAREYGSGELRLTVWQNLVVPGIPGHGRDAFLAAVGSLGLSAKAGTARDGVVACTGNAGCKFAASDTKAHAQSLLQSLGERQWKFPFNVHFTGCSHSCAQHLIGDIGLIATKIGDAGTPGYHMVLGGGSERERSVARPFAPSVPAAEVPTLVGRILDIYVERTGESISLTEWLKTYPFDELARQAGLAAAPVT